MRFLFIYNYNIKNIMLLSINREKLKKENSMSNKLNFGKYSGDQYLDINTIQEKYPEDKYSVLPCALKIKRGNVYHGSKMFSSAEEAFDHVLDLLKEFDAKVSGFIEGDIAIILYFNAPISVKERVMKNEEGLIQKIQSILTGAVNDSR